MHDDHLLIEGRLARMLDRISEVVYSDRVSIELAGWDVPGEPVPLAKGLGAHYTPRQVGDQWGPPWGTTWFRLRGTVPRDWAGRTLEAIFDIGFDRRRTGFHAEALVYDVGGEPIKGLNPRTQWIPVAAPALGGEVVEFYVEAASNPLLLGAGGFDFHPSAQGDPHTAGSEPMYRIERAELAVFEPEVWNLQQDLEVLGQLAAELSLADARRWQILRAVDRALDRLNASAIAATAGDARGELAEVLSAPAAASAHQISAVGHAHIDSAWLWPVREAVRKVARTTSNVTSLMADHPELIYAMSSAQQFAWLKEHHPKVYARVAEWVRKGRFIPVGGMWVESDTNMPGGEALARQFSYGKRYFLDEFDIETREVWLPDSFGYSAALPQLIALSNSEWFLTQKISWNKTNRFPHHSFWWEGLDGTRIFTHFPPADTYGSEISGAEIAHAARNFSDKGSATTSLLPFGWGDGGGGPTREMLARAGRLNNLDGSARVRIEAPAEFFARAEAEYTDAPIWVGELYLEMHRGTYTSQAQTKRGNRRSEHLLREAELWCATAAVRAGATYPYETLDRIWKLVLLNQFHDILPGSSIRWVHREAVANYAAAAAELNDLIAAAQGALCGSGSIELFFNAGPHTRDGVPPLSAAAVATPSPSRPSPDGDGWLLDNQLLHVHIDVRGLITSVVDLTDDREVLAPGSVGNLLQLHPDTPVLFDAWDIDSFYRHTATDLVDVESMDIVDGGVQVVRRFGDSTITQVLTLPTGHKRIDIDTDIDWHESEKLLKVGFDLDVTADRSAAEIQFGHVYRPTHTNTSWDAAKFEICAHRWVHVSEPDYGVAVVNDSTYGHDITRHVRKGGGTTTMVRVSLLRAPKSPDPVADQGHHRLRYALVPGADILDAVREGYAINLPLRTARGRRDRVEPLVTVDHAGVVVESLKLADDRTGDVVVRMYEAQGARVRTTIKAHFDHSGFHPVDLLERPRDEAGISTNAAGITIAFRPFQIVTLRFRANRLS